MKFTKETWRRMLRTFLQSAISYIAVNICVVDFTAEEEVFTSAMLGLLVSALAAGIAAVMNLEKKPIVEGEPVEDPGEQEPEVPEVTEDPEVDPDTIE